MRTDLTTAFENELTRAGRAPVQLLVFHFPTAGTVRVSDRALGPADGLSNDWAGLVEDWGTLEDVVARDPADVTIEARQMSISILNRGTAPFSDYFLKEDPEGVVVDLYQWFDGLSESDMVLIDRFVVADPIQFSERGRLVSLDLVTAVVNMDAIVGGLLSAADWPNAETDDVGKPIDVPVGNVGRVPALYARTAPAATLCGSILTGTLTVDVNEDLDALGFSAAGTIQIGEELIRYGSRTATRFNVIQRGYLTTAAEHLDRDDVVQLVADHTFLIGRGPVQSISNVKVGGYPAPAGIYSVNPSADPARVIFTEKPYAYRFAAGSSFLAMQFDAIGAGNSAVQPHYAYDAADDATAAQINENNRVLSLKQVTINPDRGAIVKAYLAVEHWESSVIVNDYAEVWVEGIGIVGRLSRPSADEGIAIDAEVDIDHGHSHQIGGDHTHSFVDPTLSSAEAEHNHITTSAGSSQAYVPRVDDQYVTLTAPYTIGARGDSVSIYFPDAPKKWDSSTLRFTAATSSITVKMNISYGSVVVANGPNTFSFGSRDASSDGWWVGFVAYGAGTYGASGALSNFSLTINIDSEIQPAITGVTSRIATSGRNQAVTSDKKSNDVNDLATENVSVEVNSTESSTKSHVNLFDITSHVNFSWSWFNDRDIKVTYQGSADNQTVYILHCFFDVEYRKRERFFSDDVTAEVVGLIDDGAGTYTGTPSALITRPDHVVRRLLMDPAGMTADGFDAATYAAAGSRLAAKGYTIDGMIRGDATVKESLKKIALQSRVRPYWSAGLSKLAFVEALADWPEGTPILAENYQLNSIAVERQSAGEIANQVDLFFARDWTIDDDGPAGFADSTRATDATSVARFGVRNVADRWLFDLVRGPAMAADLAAFYCARYSTPSTYYQVNGYLPWFAFEKEDKIQLTAGFNRLRKAKMRVLGLSRIFGSGKNRSINHVRLMLECLRYILIEQSAADAVLALDALDLSIGKLGDFSEVLAFFDDLFVSVGIGADDAVVLGDDLSLVQWFAPEFEETVPALDDLSYGIGVGIDDTVKALDDCDGWRQFGFGGGEFGVVGFGGWVIWYNRAPDEVAAFDELLTMLTPGPIAETVTIDDGLYIHSGFGCPIGSGWGLSPFGL
jgi:hypothetical protein